GVDVEKDFEPEYTVLTGRSKVLTELKKEAKGKEKVYLATDPDREGEAIGWHLKDRIFKKSKVLRVVFHEITPAAVEAAFKHPREFDGNMVEAQVGRRVLDRLVGYFLSPLLWKKIARGLSAGRVQSVALRLITDREREIQKFVPQEYWEVEAELAKKGKEGSFKAKLQKISGKEADINNKTDAENIADEIRKEEFKVAQIKKQEKNRYPDAPFITSTMQQEAFNKLRYNA
ncbi:MAG: DNA topoisomerase, partial [Candidatus Omnitrophica bacterium]|nr:DNA topoisomerase [Candidatus Omnitrophota bacterium]